jgi:tripartite-type tricarboxylate transporter receptor subunit TctC
MMFDGLGSSAGHIKSGSIRPLAIVDRLVAEVGKALDSEQVKTVWTAQGAEPGPLTPDEMANFLSAEIARWGKVADDADIKIE